MSVKEKGFQWVRSIRKSAIVGNSSCREGIPVGVLGDELTKEDKSHCDSQARRSRIPSRRHSGPHSVQPKRHRQTCEVGKAYRYCLSLLVQLALTLPQIKYDPLEAGR